MFYQINLSFFIRSSVLLSKFIIFYKIIGFAKRIYHFFIKSSVLLREFIIFYVGAAVTGDDDHGEREDGCGIVMCRENILSFIKQI